MVSLCKRRHANDLVEGTWSREMKTPGRTQRRVSREEAWAFREVTLADMWLRGAARRTSKERLRLGGDE